MAFIPHTPADVEAMLATIGVSSIEQLFEEIPAGLRVRSLSGLPSQLTEMQIGRLMSERARMDGRPLCFIGAGAYEHHIPAAVWALTTRGEFYSAYTPYQAEASQGTLQVIYEYQTMMASLTGMEVSNASLYDGASAVAEACLMAVRANRKSKSQRILVPATVHPSYRRVAAATAGNQGLRFDEVPYCTQEGATLAGALSRYEGQDITALVIQQPNFFGRLEDVDALTDWAHARNALVIAVVNPTALAALKPPGEWGARGADIAVGEGQPLGVPLSSGGPYFGFMTSRMEYVRQMPGRIVGRTLDLNGRPGFTLTLQAREQHIRRAKATSNICTNQGLLVTAATIYMSLMGAVGLERTAAASNICTNQGLLVTAATVYMSIMGAEGLERVAAASHARTRELVTALTRIGGVRLAFEGACFHEAVLSFDRPVGPLLEGLAARGILGGLDLSGDYPELGGALLVCATETKTSEDIDSYVAALSELMRDSAFAAHGRPATAA
jgi:glycine dehydrogenase subunit 1